jgi:hypothetical protein
MLVPVALLALMVLDLLTKHDGVNRRPAALILGCLLLLGLIGAPAFASGRRYERMQRR